MANLGKSVKQMFTRRKRSTAFEKKKKEAARIQGQSTHNLDAEPVEDANNLDMSMPSSSSAQLGLRQFSLAEIKKATNNFDQSMLLRKGRICEVYKGTYDDYDGKQRTVAIKAFKAFNSGTPFQEALNTWFQQELEVWSQYRHEHVVLVIGYCREVGWNIIVYQHMVNGSLANNLCKKITPTSFYLSWEQCLHICIDAAHGFEYMHAHISFSNGSKFYLGDVSATNILLDDNGVAKICDLYLEQFEGSYNPSFYFDPEFQSTGVRHQSSDVYAFGVLLVKVLSRKVFFDKEDHNLGIWFKKCIVNGTIHDQIIHPEMKAEIPPDCLTSLVGIAGECLNDESTKRPSISQVVKKLELLMESSSRRAQLGLRQFSLAEIKKATNNFDQSMLLKNGWIWEWEVYKGTYDDYDGKQRTVAIKAFKPGTLFQEALNTWFEQELEVLSQYRHEHVVLVIGYCRELGWNIIVYQHMVNGSLANNLCKKITPTSFYLSWEQCLRICIDAARGLEYMHAHISYSKGSKFHLGHVAATNILLDENDVAKICDLYLEPFKGPYDHLSCFFDPEVLSTGVLSQSSEVYAFGVLLVKVLSRKVFFDKEDQDLGIWFKKCIVNGTIHDQIIHPEMKAEIPPDCLISLVGIAGECLNDESTKRPSISQVVKRLELLMASSSRLLMASSSRRACYNYSFHEIEDVTNNFESILGQGGEGIVYKGMTKTTNTSFAVKCLKPGLSSEFQKEIKMLPDLDHPNIVSLVGYCQESDKNILIYELMSNGNLAQSLYSTSNSLSWMQRLKICIGAARGLAYLHRRTNISPKGIIHRDVKPVNILLDDNLDAKIADFGLCKMSPQDQENSEIHTTIKGTPGYYAPEYQHNRKITRKIDVYAFGIVLCEVLCKKKRWDSEESFYPSENEKYGQWAKENIDPDLKGLIAPMCLETFVIMLEKCLNMDPKRRPTMNDVVSVLEYAMKWQEAWQRHKSGGDFCIPGGEDRVILYCTSNSQSSIYARLFLRRFTMIVDERDLVNDICVMEFKHALGNTADIHMPQLFVQGKHIGDINEMEKLYATGKLAELLRLPLPLFICEICQEARACAVCKCIEEYVHCSNCGALRLIIWRYPKGQPLPCHECNANQRLICGAITITLKVE